MPDRKGDSGTRFNWNALNVMTTGLAACIIPIVGVMFKFYVDFQVLRTVTAERDKVQIERIVHLEKKVGKIKDNLKVYSSNYSLIRSDVAVLKERLKGVTTSLGAIQTSIDGVRSLVLNLKRQNRRRNTRR